MCESYRKYKKELSEYKKEGVFLKLRHRIVSAVLAFALTVSYFIYFPIKSDAAKSADNNGYVSLDGIHLNYDNTLTKLDDGTYELISEIYSTHAMEEMSVYSQYTKDDFYVAKKDGTYLVELFGGNGGSISPDGTTLGKGGIGGKGGHVYATIEMKAGDILFFTIGGNGTKTNEVGEGGGAGGPGGTHGGSGNTTVGGGGGYSAVYLFDGKDFEGRYLDSNGKLVRNTLLETDRISKYVMIAGGGGGAGAYSMDSSALPNGGNGGSIGHTTGVLSGSAYDVEGTFFVGGDGLSSGGNLSYSGKGGSNVPGQAIGSILGWTDTQTPNDWRGTYNSSLPGGAGGAGNLRGGSGGAGFCGGSGGLMASFIIPNNVGGGGGGSSFISSLMDYELSSEQALALKNTNPSQTGGAIYITYMEREDLSYLEDLTLSFNSSDYFSVIFAEAVNSSTPKLSTRATKLENEHATVEYKFEHVRALVGEVLTVRIVFEPMLHFAGGNNVPLFEHGKMFVVTPDGNAHGSGDIEFEDACGYVNVPLNFTLHPQNHNTNDPGHHHAVKDLYVDNYAEVRKNLDAHPAQFNFIEKIGDYQVTTLDGVVLPTSGEVTPSETTKYFLLLTVTPKSIAETGVATVGDVVTETTFSSIITVTVAGSNTVKLNGNWVTYSKTLSYNNTTKEFCLSLGFKSDTNRQLTDLPELPNFTYTPGANGQAATQVQTTVIQHSGYYYIEIWGGDGGHGGQSAWFGSSGGAGGKGGYMGGYVYLQKGDILHVHIGANGEDGDNGTGFLAGGLGGSGGEASLVALMTEENGEHVVDRYIMIAGGGSGGSGGWAGMNQEGKSPSVTDTSIPNEIDTLKEALAKYSGKSGSSGGLSISQSAAGNNAYDSTIYNQNAPGGNNNLGTFDTTQFGEGKYKNNGGGAFRLSYLQLDEINDGNTAQKLENYDALVAISKYFEVVRSEVIDYNTKDKISANLLVTDANPTFTAVHVQDITPIISNVTVGGTSYEAVNFTINIYVKPHEDFLGGNDVMLVDVSEETRDATGLDTGIAFVQEFKNANGDTVTGSFNVIENSSTDYANVPINWDAIDEAIITTRNKVHLVGESNPVMLSELYKIDQTRLEALKAEFNAREAWCKDYVYIMDTPSISEDGDISAYLEGDISLAPELTTSYTLSFGIMPKAPSYYARAGIEATPVVQEKTVTVYAAHRVEFDLAEHIYHDSTEIKDLDPLYIGDGTPVYIAEVGKDYEIEFFIEEGAYSLPSTVTITLGGWDGAQLTSLIDYKYSTERETLTIHAESITDSIHIKINETSSVYSLHYLVQMLDGGVPSMENFSQHTVELYAGDPIHASTHYADALAKAGITNTDITGYTFSWDWGDGRAEPFDEMPVGDWWILGTFSPKEYTVKIRYVDTNGNVLAEEYSAVHRFGEEISITSPTIVGYKTDTAAYTATIDAALINDAVDGVITKDVVYTSLQDEVVINLLLEDGSVYDVCKIVFDFGKGEYTVLSQKSLTYVISAIFDGERASYGVVLPSVIGHHTENAQIIAEISAGGGNIHDITYLANRYTLKFNTLGGECSETERLVVYGKPYTYDGVTYTSLPRAIKVGSTFKGWTDADGNLIDENSSVLTDAENGAIIPVRALWEANKFTLTVKHVYEDGSAVAEFADVSTKVEYGAAYRYTAPALDGYTVAPDSYSGVMPAQNLELVFTYYEDSALEEISVTITWGDLTFSAEYGVWNPDALAYEKDVFTPNTKNQNTVTVMNNSTSISVSAGLSYNAEVGLESIDGYFTSENSADARKTSSMSLGFGEQGTAYVWLGGELTDGLAADTSTKCGTVTVTITPQN